jgi:pimeloyl-ACP methyl ester carboxylesterase
LFILPINKTPKNLLPKVIPVYASVNNTKLYFDVDGSGLRAEGPEMEAKPVVIVLHGSFFEHSCFKPGLNSLAENFQVVYLDFRGFGRSDLSTPEYWTIDQLAGDVIGLMDYLGIDQAHFLSHSFGCCIAIRIANTHPQRVNSNLLINPVLINQSVFLDNVASLAGNEAVAAAQDFFIDRKVAATEAYLSLVAPHLFQRPAPPDMMARGQMNIEFTLHTLEEVLRLNWRHELELVKTPTLACSGSKDIYMAKGTFQHEIDAVNNRWVMGQEFEKSGHFILNDQADELLIVINQFFSRHS